MPQKYTQARRDGNRKWDAANLDRISIAAPKGTRDALKRAADAAGQSVNQFIIDKLAPWIAAPSPDAAPDQTEKAPD